jgi:predicted secreted protein
LAYCKPFESNSTIETSINIVKISNINNITTTNKDIFLDDTFELQLPSNVTTGFCWIWSNIKYCSHLDTFNHSYIPDTLHVCCGRGGTEIWKFKGINLGTDTIILKYCQPWDTTSTAETQDIIVNVTNKASSLPNQIYDNIKVYPVPAKESLNIEFQNLNYNGYLVEIFNLNGISILNKKVTTSTEFLNLDNLISGSYILVISDNNNVVLRKLISVIK